MNVRPARPTDAEGIRQVSARSCRGAYEDILDDETLIVTMEDPGMAVDIREWLTETREDDRVVYLVTESEDDGEIHGFAQVLVGERAPDRTDDDEAFLKSLYVDPDHWGERIGSALLDDALERLPDSIARLSLSVLADNDVGRGFYESRGFEQVGTSAYEIGGVSYDTAVYATSLTSGE